MDKVVFSIHDFKDLETWRYLCEKLGYDADDVCVVEILVQPYDCQQC